MSSNKLVSCIWRWVDAGNQWKVGYEGGMAENVGGRGFRVCVGPEMVTETRNKFG